MKKKVPYDTLLDSLYKEMEEGINWIKQDEKPKKKSKKKRKSSLLSPQTKAANTRARKKHYQYLNEMRAQIIYKHFPQHLGHNYLATDTRYESNVIQCEFIYCECQVMFKITKEMFNEANQGEDYVIQPT